MSALLHTQTPWVLTTVQTSSGICHKIGPFPPKPGTTREMHACVYADYPGDGPHDAEVLANARLIAAAPDLLTAMPTVNHPAGPLVKVVAHYSDGTTQTIDGSVIVAAIAKATGSAA